MLSFSSRFPSSASSPNLNPSPTTSPSKSKFEFTEDPVPDVDEGISLSYQSDDNLMSNEAFGGAAYGSFNLDIGRDFHRKLERTTDRKMSESNSFHSEFRDGGIKSKRSALAEPLLQSKVEKSDSEDEQRSKLSGPIRQNVYSRILFEEETAIPRLRLLTSNDSSAKIRARKREIMGCPVTKQLLARLDRKRPLNLTRVDLSGLDLSGYNLNYAILIAANLKAAVLIGAKLHKADLSMARLQEAILEGADLTNTNLFCANFKRAALTAANLSGANMRGAILKGANLSAAKLIEVNLTYLKNKKIEQVTNQWNGVDLTEAVLSGLDFSHVKMQNAILRHADLRGVKFERTDLRGAQIGKIDRERLARIQSNSCFGCCKPRAEEIVSLIAEFFKLVVA